MARPSTIAIDGTAASGKSTIGGLLAAELGYVYFDTGVLYRAVTLEAIRRGIPIGDEAAVTGLAGSLNIAVERPTVEDGRQYTILTEGRDVTWGIRGDEVEAKVSPVSAYPGVRAVLMRQQRQMGLRGHIVMVGRDIGTVILPEADLKIFLDASLEERARRRTREMRARGVGATYEEVLEATRRRDQIDSGRSVAPLAIAKDAHYVYTDGMDIEQVMEKVRELVNGWSAEHCEEDRPEASAC